MATTLPEITEDDRAFLEKDRVHPDLWMRIVVERAIFRCTAKALMEAGYSLRLFDGEEWATPITTSLQVLMDEMFATDEEQLVVYDSTGKKCGWVFFVYGNSGWDVINDYTTNLEPVLASINAYTDELSELWY